MQRHNPICFEDFEKVADSAGRALGSIICKFKFFLNFHFKSYSKLYEAGVLPVAHYAASIWGNVTGKEIECIHNRAMRYFLGVHKFAPNAAVTADMGWLAPKYRRYICMLRFWNRLMDMDENRLTRHIF